MQGVREVQQALPRIHISIKLELPFNDLLYPRNHRFTGRDKELAFVDSCLGGPDLSSCTIHGIAGVGKTQLAVEYTHKYSSKFEYMMWLPAESPTELASAFTSLHGKLHLHDNNVDQKSRVQAVRDWLGRSKYHIPIDNNIRWMMLSNEIEDKNWLLIFDNVESWKSIAPYWPPLAKGSILLTTQNPELSQVTKDRIRLQSLSPENGAKLLLNYFHQA